MNGLRPHTHRRSLALLAAITLGATSAAAQTYSGNLTLTSQAEVNAFSYTAVTGHLIIDGQLIADITDLTPLSSLVSVGGTLTILACPLLTNLDGLGNLTSVGNNLFVSSNAALTNLNGLSSLASVGNQLGVSGNSALTNLDGLSSLVSVVHLFVQSNAALTNLDGLSSITATGFLFVQNNAALTSLDGLSSITSVGVELDVRYNHALTNLDGLGSITSVGGDVGVVYNASLTNLAGLSSITSVGGNLLVLNNDALTNLDGLGSITSVGGNLEVTDNGALTNLDGLSSLISLGGDLNILDNPQLTSFCGLYPLFLHAWPVASVTIQGNAANPDPVMIVLAGPCAPGHFSLFAASNCDGGRVLTLVGDPQLGGTVVACMSGFRGLPFVTWGFGNTTQPFLGCNCEVLTLATRWQYGNAISLTIPSGQFFLGMKLKAQGADLFVKPPGAPCVPIEVAFTNVQMLTVGA